MRRQPPDHRKSPEDVSALFPPPEEAAESLADVGPLGGLAQFAPEDPETPAAPRRRSATRAPRGRARVKTTAAARAEPRTEPSTPAWVSDTADTADAATPPATTEARLAQALGCYERAMFGGDTSAHAEGAALVTQVLRDEPDHAEARTLEARFDTLGRMLAASPKADPLVSPASAPTDVPRSDATPSAPVRTTAAATAPGSLLAEPAAETPETLVELPRWPVGRGTAAAVIGAAVLLVGLIAWGPGGAVSRPTADMSAALAAPASETGTAPPAPAAPAIPTTPEVVLSEAHDQLPFADATLSAEARSRLGVLATQVLDHPDAVVVEIEGHTDALGDAVYNEQLGLARAESVRDYLSAQHGVPLDRMVVTSYGETRPVASNDTTAGRAENRRIVVRVVGRPAS